MPSGSSFAVTYPGVCGSRIGGEGVCVIIGLAVASMLINSPTRTRCTRSLIGRPTWLIESANDLRAHSLKRCARGHFLVMRSKSEAKFVTGKAGENVQVHMKDFLHRSLAISQEEIDAFALHAATADRGRYSLRLSHEPPRRWRVEIGKIRCMPHRDH